VFGLSPIEIAALSKRFTFMTSPTYPAGTYRGQTSQVNTVAAWNIAIVARSTLGANATKNTVVPYHLGARRALASGARRDDSRLNQEFLSEVDP
jgi:hypothetical protein